MMTEETVLAQWDDYKRVCTLEDKLFIKSCGGRKAMVKLMPKAVSRTGTGNDILDLFGQQKAVNRDTLRDRFVVKFGWDDRKNCAKRFHTYVRRLVNNGTLSLDTELGKGHKVRLVRTRMPYQRPWA